MIGLGAFLAVALILPTSASRQHPETGFLNGVVVAGSVMRRYQVFVPSEDTPSRRWPVILFLHGGGEEGNFPKCDQARVGMLSTWTP